MDLAYLGEINCTRAVDGELRVEINLPPNANDELIAWSEDVVGSHIGVADRSKGRRHLQAEERVAVNRKQTAQRSANQQLEISGSGNARICQGPCLLQGLQLGRR